jgi:hypothetical protein
MKKHLQSFAFFSTKVNVESMGRCPPQEIPLEACNALLANTKSVRASLKLQMDVMF